MKETKVYVDKLPKGCADCICEYDVFGEISGKYVSVAKSKNCPLQTIKQHDRELVKEVCEKIKLKFSDTRSHNWGIEQFELYEFLDQIQKEYDK